MKIPAFLTLEFALVGFCAAQNLGVAAPFAVLGASAVTNAGGLTTVNGDLGVYPGTAITGFPPGRVVAPGTIHSADQEAQNAQAAALSAYNVAAGLPATSLTGDLGGMTLVAGVYNYGSSAGLTGTLTLDAKGDPNGVWVFQIGSTLTTASNSAVLLVNGARACNVFWQVGSSATFGTGTQFVGSVLAQTSITLTTGVNSMGGLFALTGAVTLDDNVINIAGTCANIPASTGVDSSASNTGADSSTSGSETDTPTSTVVETNTHTGPDTSSTGPVNTPQTATITSTSVSSQTYTGTTYINGTLSTTRTTSARTFSRTTETITGSTTSDAQHTTVSITRGTTLSETLPFVTTSRIRYYYSTTTTTTQTIKTQTTITCTTYTTRSFTVTCPVGPTTITSYSQTFTIPTACVTILTCTPATVTIPVVVFTTYCPTIPTCITTGGETFSITTTGMCTLTCTKCATTVRAPENIQAPPIHPTSPVATSTQLGPPSTTVEAAVSPTLIFTGGGSRLLVTECAGVIGAFLFVFLY
jgi:hypothetical protein